MPSIVTNFKFKSTAPNFERDQIKYLNDLKNAKLEDYDIGHIVFCIEGNKHYVFGVERDLYGNLLKSNETGYFSEFKTGAFNGNEMDSGTQRTAFVFKESKEAPAKPSGFSWDIYNDKLTTPANSNGWTQDDSELEAPIWMSVGTFNISNPTLESWTTPIVISGADGRPGADGTTMEFIYMRTYTEEQKPDTPYSNSTESDDNIDVWLNEWTWIDPSDSTNIITFKWTDHPSGVDDTYQCEWMCQRFKKTNEDGESVWGPWNEGTGGDPILWSKYGVMGKDGDGVEYIYKRTYDNVAPTLPEYDENTDEYQNSENEYLPQAWKEAGWTDNPTGTDSSMRYEWMCVRKFKNNVWSRYSEPALWSYYGQDNFKSMVFTKSNTQPATPIDANMEDHGKVTNWDNPIPVDPAYPNSPIEWFDSIPPTDAEENENAIIWMSSKTFYGDEAKDSSTPWSLPVKLADSADFDVEFNDCEEYPGTPDDPKFPEDYPWYDNQDYDSNVINAIWMATRICKNGEWGAWSVVKIKGEKGQDGTSVQILGTYAIYEELYEAYINKSLKQNPPEIGDSYIVSTVNVDENGNWIEPIYNEETGEWENATDYKKTTLNQVLFSWDGDSWQYLGKFQGDSAYVYIKYSTNPDVMTNPAGVPDSDLMSSPTGANGAIAKYIGICTTDKKGAPSMAASYVWSKFVGADGFGYAYVYIRTKTEEAPDIPADLTGDDIPENYYDINYAPGDWTDEPSGVNSEYPYEWMSYRKFANDEWSNWIGSKVNVGKAILHNVWADSGFVSFAFIKTNDDISGMMNSVALTGTYNNPLPTMKDEDGIVDDTDVPGKVTYNGKDFMWEDSIPVGNPNNPHEIIWMTSAKFTLAMDGVNQHPVWSAPRPMSDTSELDVDWSPMDIPISAIGNPDSNGSMWWENSATGNSIDGSKAWPTDENGTPVSPIWMATRNLKNGEPVEGESWTVTRIKGEKGDKGADGTGLNITGKYKYFSDFKADVDKGADGPLANPITNASYIIEFELVDGQDVPLGEVWVYTPSSYDGINEISKWTNVGRLQGEPGKPVYAHFRYSLNPDVLENVYNVEPSDIYVTPVIGGVPAKYLGIASNNDPDGPKEASAYKWSKFVGEDGVSYEYIYTRTQKNEAPIITNLTSTNEDDYTPEEWTDGMQGVSTTYPFEWTCYRKKSTIGGIYQWGKWKGTTVGEQEYAVLANHWSEKEYSTMYYLNISPLIVKVDKFGNKSSNSISVGVQSKKGDEFIDSTSLPTGWYIRCNYTNGDVAVNSSVTLNEVSEPITFILYNNENKVVDTETIPVLTEEANLVADLTNDSYSVTCNNFGVPVNNSEVASTTLHMYYGLDEVAINTIKIKPLEESDTLTVNAGTNGEHAYDSYKVSVVWGNSNKSATINVTNIDDSAPLASNFTIEGTTAYGSRTMNFTVNKVVPGGKTPTLYQLVPSATSIVLNKENSSLTPSTISIKINKYSGASDGSDAMEVLNEVPEDFYVDVYRDGSNEYTYASGEELGSHNTKDTDISLEFKLRHKESGVVHDIYIPLLKDGKDGVSPTLYKLSSDVTTIRKSGNTYDKTTLSLSILMIKDGNISNTSLPAEYTIHRNNDYSDSWSAALTLLSNISISGATKMISFELRNNNGTAVDRLMIPILSDGENGQITDVYSLFPTTSTVTKDANGSISPTSIKCHIAKASGSSIDIIETTLTSYKMICVCDMGSKKVYINKNGEITSVEYNDTNIENNLSNYEWSGNQSIGLSTLSTIFNKGYKSIEFHIYSTANKKIIDTEVIPFLKDGAPGQAGAPGQSSAVMNLTNDMIAVQCDSSGNLSSGTSYQATTQVELYYGTSKLTLTGVNISGTTSYVTASNNNGLITVTVKSGAADTTNLTITASGKNSSGDTITLSKVLKVVKVKQGPTGPQGQGSKGEKGALMRNLGYWNDIATNFQFYSGKEGELYIDYVFYPGSSTNEVENPKTYLCKTSHKKSNSNPQVPGSSSNWEEATQFKFVSTDLLNAKQIVTKVIQSDSSIIAGAGGEFAGTDNGARTKVVTKNGIIEFFYNLKPDSGEYAGVNGKGWVKSVDIGYDKNTNTGVLRFWDGTAASGGNLLYNLGPGGLLANSLFSPQVASAAYMTDNIVMNFGNPEFSVDSLINYNHYMSRGTIDDIEENKDMQSGNTFSFTTTSGLSDSNAETKYFEFNSKNLITMDNLFKYKYMNSNTLGNVIPQQTMLFDIYNPVTSSIISKYTDLPGNPTDDTPAYLNANQENLIPTGFGTIGYAALHNNCKNLAYDDINFNFSGIGKSRGTLMKPKRRYFRYMPALTDIEEIFVHRANNKYLLSVGEFITNAGSDIYYDDIYFPPYFYDPIAPTDPTLGYGYAPYDYNDLQESGNLKFEFPASRNDKGEVILSTNGVFQYNIPQATIQSLAKCSTVKEMTPPIFYKNANQEIKSMFVYDASIARNENVVSLLSASLINTINQTDENYNAVMSVINEAYGFLGYMIKGIQTCHISAYTGSQYITGHEPVSLDGFSDIIYKAINWASHEGTLKSNGWPAISNVYCRRNSICLAKEMFRIMNHAKIKFFDSSVNSMYNLYFVGYIFPEDMIWSNSGNTYTSTATSPFVKLTAINTGSSPLGNVNPVGKLNSIYTYRRSQENFNNLFGSYGFGQERDILFVERHSSKIGLATSTKNNNGNVYALYIANDNGYLKAYVKRTNYVGGYISSSNMPNKFNNTNSGENIFFDYMI